MRPCALRAFRYSAAEPASGIEPMSSLADGRMPERLVPNLAVLVAGSVCIAALSFAALPLPAAIASSVLGALMVAGADVDSRTFLIPDTVSFGAITAGLVAAFALNPWAPWSALGFAALRGVGMAAVLAALAFVYIRLRGQEGLGLGDVKLAGAAGVWLPPEILPLCFALAAAAALVAVGLARLRGQPLTRATAIPFGAFLCPALWLSFYASALTT